MSKCPMALFEPLKLGRYTLRNRIIMAPLTRVRATESHVPQPMMVKHYADRASAGLIIAEATIVAPGYSSFKTEPGIYDDAQIEGWRRITDAVHAKGGLIFLQLYHGGRAAPPYLVPNRHVVAPSAIPIVRDKMRSHISESGKEEPYAVPSEITLHEMDEVKQCFVQAAKNAITAGFDGVEVHCANGYLLDEFLRESSNTRSAPYGGSVENRIRYPLEVVAAVCDAIGADRVGVRISPIASVNDESDSDPEQLTKYFCRGAEALHLAYLHVLRIDRLDLVKGNALPWARDNYSGTVIANGSYSLEEAEEDVRQHRAEAIAFGKLYIANADLVERVRSGAKLNAPLQQYFYSSGEVGYNDYPLMADLPA